MTRRYSALSLLREGLNGQRGWEPAWRDPEPKPHYDANVIGDGGHGLATAYYLAKNHGLTNVALIERGSARRYRSGIWARVVRRASPTRAVADDIKE